MDIPSHEDLDNFRSITIMVSTPGMNILEEYIVQTNEEYIIKGWTLEKVGISLRDLKIPV